MADQAQLGYFLLIHTEKPLTSIFLQMEHISYII